MKWFNIHLKEKHRTNIVILCCSLTGLNGEVHHAYMGPSVTTQVMVGATNIS